MADYFQATCKCGKEMRVPSSMLGKRIPCPVCGKVKRLPSEIKEDEGPSFANDSDSPFPNGEPEPEFAEDKPEPVSPDPYAPSSTRPVYLKKTGISQDTLQSLLIGWTSICILLWLVLFSLVVIRWNELLDYLAPAKSDSSVLLSFSTYFLGFILTMSTVTGIWLGPAVALLVGLAIFNL
ncbi:MAG: hypothetical protein ACE5HX_14780, partial [bacterium]